MVDANLTAENEAYLASLIASRQFADRGAALNAAVGLLRQQQDLCARIEAGVAQLDAGLVRRYEPDELDRFLTDVEQRQKLQQGSR